MGGRRGGTGPSSRPKGARLSTSVTIWDGCITHGLISARPTFLFLWLWMLGVTCFGFHVIAYNVLHCLAIMVVWIRILACTDQQNQERVDIFLAIMSYVLQAVAATTQSRHVHTLSTTIQKTHPVQDCWWRIRCTWHPVKSAHQCMPQLL